LVNHFVPVKIFAAGNTCCNGICFSVKLMFFVIYYRSSMFC